MSIFLTLLRRELAAFFYSLAGYIIIAAITLLVGQGFMVEADRAALDHRVSRVPSSTSGTCVAGFAVQAK